MRPALDKPVEPLGLGLLDAVSLPLGELERLFEQLNAALELRDEAVEAVIVIE